MNRRKMKEYISTLEGLLSDRGATVILDGHFYQVTYEGNPDLDNIFFSKDGGLYRLTRNGTLFTHPADFSVVTQNYTIKRLDYKQMSSVFTKWLTEKGITPGTKIYSPEGSVLGIPKDKKPTIFLDFTEGVFLNGVLVWSPSKGFAKSTMLPEGEDSGRVVKTINADIPVLGDVLVTFSPGAVFTEFTPYMVEHWHFLKTGIVEGGRTYKILKDSAAKVALNHLKRLTNG